MPSSGTASVWLRFALGTAAVLWVLPLWQVDLLPMLDYPQQLALAAIVRWIGDPVRAFGQAYELALWRPQGLFEVVTAGFAWVMPIDLAGKLVLSLSLAGVLPASAALCRRNGRPEWYALLALAVTYNHVFFWGFVDSLVALPLFLGGVALADRLLEGPFGFRSWLLLAVSTLVFYTAHLQMLVLFVGAVGWLALVRRPPARRLVLQLSALLPGLALGAGVLLWAHFHAAEVMSGFQRYLDGQSTILCSTKIKTGRLAGLLFGVYADGTQEMLGALLVLIALILAARWPRWLRRSDDWNDRLFRARFGLLAGWIALLYFIVPEFTHGYLVSERLIPVAVTVGVAALPRPSLLRLRAAAALTLLLAGWQLSAVRDGFRTFNVETAGLRRVLDRAEPGQALAGLLFEQSNSTWMVPSDLLRHAPAYYQVYKGGRILLSFVQFFNAPVRFKPGENWEDRVLSTWREADAYQFELARDGGRFRYFLVRGGRDDLARAFGPRLAGARVTSSVRWHLVDLAGSPPRQRVTALSSSPP
jgi:hypothetical protein